MHAQADLPLEIIEIPQNLHSKRRAQVCTAFLQGTLLRVLFYLWLSNSVSVTGIVPGSKQIGLADLNKHSSRSPCSPHRQITRFDFFGSSCRDHTELSGCGSHVLPSRAGCAACTLEPKQRLLPEW